MNGWTVFAIVYVVMTICTTVALLERKNGLKDVIASFIIGLLWWVFIGAKIIQRILAR
jgi:hypothetical protein